MKTFQSEKLVVRAMRRKTLVFASVILAFFTGVLVCWSTFSASLSLPSFPKSPDGNINSALRDGQRVISPILPPPPTSTDSRSFKTVMTSLFWVGEGADESNGFISNTGSFWDSFWLGHFGGVDDPGCRSGFSPCDFLPKENPFYVALPYTDIDEKGKQKASASRIPWRKTIPEGQSLLKNHWVEIVYGGKICYGQWQDVGPLETDDVEYVFGMAAPRNTFGVEAGLDVSPALWSCLGLEDNTDTKWRFVEESEVPEGVWKAIITRRGVSH